MFEKVPTKMERRYGVGKKKRRTTRIAGRTVRWSTRDRTADILERIQHFLEKSALSD